MRIGTRVKRSSQLVPLQVEYENVGGFGNKDEDAGKMKVNITHKNLPRISR